MVEWNWNDAIISQPRERGVSKVVELRVLIDEVPHVLLIGMKGMRSIVVNSYAFHTRIKAVTRDMRAALENLDVVTFLLENSCCGRCGEPRPYD